MGNKIKEPVITYDQAESMSQKIGKLERSGDVSNDYLIGFTAACSWLSGDCTQDISLKEYAKKTYHDGNMIKDINAILELVFGGEDK